MQEPEAQEVPLAGPVPRRKRQLAPIQTAFPPQQNVPQVIQRPPPIETIIYKTSPPVEHPPALKHRPSKAGFFGLFHRNKNQKEDLDHHAPKSEQESFISAQTPSREPSIPNVKLPEDKAGRSKTPPVKKDRPTRTLMTWDPPPLFQAYPQAIKHSNLSAPKMSADSLLRHRQKMDGSQDLTGTDTQESTTESEANETEPKKKSKNSSSLHIDWTTKIYVLSTSGYLLQYSGSGHHDRLPEKIMQLSKDSAAFASDVIPGRHWVLQICQTSTDDGVVAPGRSRSVLSRLGLRSDLKRSVSNFLLVMDTAEDMDSWLVAVRKEIQALGGKSYIPEIVARKPPAEVLQELQQKPSRRFLIKRNPSSNFNNLPIATDIPQKLANQVNAIDLNETPSGGEAGSGKLHRMLARKSSSNSITKPAKLTKKSSNASLNRLNVQTRRSSSNSVATASTIRPEQRFSPDPSRTPKPSSPQRRRSSNRSSRISPSSPPSSTKSGSSNSPTSARISARRASMMTQSDKRRSSETRRGSISSRPRSSHRSSSERSSISPTTAQNFSLPTLNHRWSQGPKSQATTPPTSAGSTCRGPSPSLTDGESVRAESTRPDSIVGELPVGVRSASKYHHFQSGDVTLSLPLSPARTLDDQNDHVMIVPSSPGFDRPEIPHRLSSLEYGNGWIWAEPDEESPERSSESKIPPRRYSSLEYSKQMAKLHAHNGLLTPPNRSPPSIPSVVTPSQKFAVSSENLPSSTDIRSGASPKLYRPASMQIRSVAQGSKPRRQSAMTNTSFNPPNKQSFLSRTSIHGPPMAPPPSEPLPDLPPVANVITKPDHHMTSTQGLHISLF